MGPDSRAIVARVRPTLHIRCSIQKRVMPPRKQAARGSSRDRRRPAQASKNQTWSRGEPCRDHLKPIVEALIFASPDPVTPKTLYKLLDV